MIMNTPLKQANLSDDRKSRYTLTRIWNHNSERLLLFIMLNPSTADENNDDQTIRRIMDFAQSWGYDGIHVGNIYALRSRDPKQIKHLKHQQDGENIEWIKKMRSKVQKVVYAWGNKHKEPNWLKQIVETPYCISISKKGIPKHPLYLRKNLQLQLWERQ